MIAFGSRVAATGSAGAVSARPEWPALATWTGTGAAPRPGLLRGFGGCRRRRCLRWRVAAVQMGHLSGAFELVRAEATEVPDQSGRQKDFTLCSLS